MRATAIRRLNEQRGSSAQISRTSIPLSVKTRLGYDEVIVDRWIEHLLAESPTAISLHGRTLQQMYRGEADWSAIARAAEVVRGSGTLLFGNGDVQSLQEVVWRARETGVDGVLVGRAALGAPWFFRGNEGVRKAVGTQGVNGPEAWNPSLAARFDVLLGHARLCEMQWGRDQFRRMRKHLGWYCKGFPHAAALRASMFRASSVADVEAMLADYRASRIVDGQAGSEISSSDIADDTTSMVSRCG